MPEKGQWVGWIVKRRQTIMNPVLLDGNRKSQCELSFEESSGKAINIK